MSWRFRRWPRSDWVITNQVIHFKDKGCSDAEMSHAVYAVMQQTAGDLCALPFLIEFLNQLLSLRCVCMPVSPNTGVHSHLALQLRPKKVYINNPAFFCEKWNSSPDSLWLMRVQQQHLAKQGWYFFCMDKFHFWNLDLASQKPTLPCCSVLIWVLRDAGLHCWSVVKVQFKLRGDATSALGTDTFGHSTGFRNRVWF